MTPNPASKTGKWRTRCFVLLGIFLGSMVLMSFPSVRAFVVAPLFVHQPGATGEVAYVMADGHAYWERLRAASDLYNQKQVDRILILAEMEPTGFNFQRNRLDTRVERATDHLRLFGVPDAHVDRIPINTSTIFGSLNEAHGVAKSNPELKRLVVVTSAPHTRRSLLAFERTMPKSVHVQIYSASDPKDSAEITAPIWLEYAKLVVYFFVA